MYIASWHWDSVQCPVSESWRSTVAAAALNTTDACVCSKSRRGSSGIYEKDEKLTEKERELMEKDAEVLALSVCLSVSLTSL